MVGRTLYSFSVSIVSMLQFVNS